LLSVNIESALRDGTCANGRKEDHAMAAIGTNWSKGKASIKKPPNQRHLPSSIRFGRKFLPLMVVNL
jgi:hypothetical protein